MLTVPEDLFIARGYHRECYQHPSNENLCVKVVVRGDTSETDREIRYYNVLKKRHIDWKMLPRYHGWVNTNKGKAAVFDLIRDCDGKVSLALNYYLENPELTSQFRDQIGNALVGLHDYLISHRVVTMTLKPKNIVLSRIDEEKSKLVIVDNIGNSDWVPLCNYVDFLALKKIRRKWQRFIELLRNSYAYNDQLQALVTQLPNKVRY
ncbi:YrbL family protein [Aurantivibrio plasticivorans]